MIPGGRDSKIFSGVMDKDTEARYLASGNYRNLLNARSSINSEGSFGAIEDVMGNVLVNNPFLTNGRNKVLGSYEDIAGQSCIFFVWNEFGYHGIYRWYANRTGFPNGVIEKVYQVVDPVDNCLDFQEYNLINHVNLAGDLLLWVDGAEEPRCMNIVRADRTNKNLTFNLFFNPSTFGISTTYSLTIYGQVTYTLTWTSSGVDYESQVNDFYNAANADPNVVALVNVTPRINYAEIEFLSPGDFMISATVPLFLLPENFYPDKSNNPVTYAPLSKQLITNVKYPPFCAPHVQYINTNVAPSQTTTALFTPYTWTDPGGGVIFNGYLGINVPNVNYPDNLGIISAGPTNVIAGWPPYGTPSAWVKNPTASSKQYTINLQGSVTNSGFTGAFNFTFGKFNPAQPSLAPTQGVTIFQGSPPYGNFNVTITVTIAPGEKWGLYTYGSQGSVIYTGPFGGILLTATEVTSSTNLFYPDIQEKFFQFRAKYVYNDNQESVYGAISSIPLPNDISQNVIQIDFSDNRLSIPELACDVKKVVLAYTIDAGTTWFDFKELMPYEFAGPGKQVYLFDGKEVGLIVPSAEASLQFHNIPIISNAQELIDNRVFYGANVTGYDKVIANMNFSYIYQDLTNNLEQTGRTSKLGWKRGYEGYVGIVYYDDADRKSPVIIDENSSKIRVPYYYDNTPNAQTWDAVYLQWQIFHEPPSYAKKYHFVRTKDLLQVRYLMWYPDYVFVTTDLITQVAAQAVNAAYIRFDMASIAYYNDNSNLGAKIELTVAQGDRLRFIQRGNVFFTNENEFIIAAVDTQYIYIKNPKWTALGTGNASAVYQAYIEVYTPNPSASDEIYYEFSECYEVKEGLFNGVLRKYHDGPTPQDYSTNTPASGVSYEGNVFYRFREIPYGYNGTTWLSIANNIISAYTPSDFSNVFFDNNGRPNSLKFNEQEFDGASLIFTDKFTNVTNSLNGINAVQAGNDTSYNTEYGNIAKLQVVNNDILKLVFSNSYQLSIYVSQGVIRQSQANANLIAVSDEVAGNSHIIQRTLGTINAESVRVNDEGDMFGYDENEGVVWISSGNGLIQISDRGMKSVFKRYSNERKATGGISETPCVYDLYHDEYIITLANMNGFVGVTIAYNKQKQGWTSYYSFVPEYYGRVRDYIVSFKSGQLWIHDRSTVAKNFYGIQYNRQLTYVSNKDFPKVKDFKAISINGIGLNDVPSIRILPFQGYINGMLSSLSKRFFQVLEGIQYAYFQKDRLSPGFGGNQLQALANGRNLKGQVLEVTLENDDTAKSSIYSSDIVYFYSEHS